MDFVWLMAGLVLLVVGAEQLVSGASRLAVSFGVSPLVVGLTVVAYGTGAPEMAVSAQSAAMGAAEMAVGNVVGSNIFNVLFILGLAAMLAPLTVHPALVRRDLPLVVGSSGLVWWFALDGSIGAFDALVLFGGAITYTVWLIRGGQGGDDVPADAGGSRPLQAAQVIGGLALLVLGARWLVYAAVNLATAWGLSEAVIGLTIVAAGTSLPEVATSIVATLRGQRDIAIGNVVGSNLFNALAVLGVAGLLSPGGLPVVPTMLAFDLPFMLGVALVCVPVFYSGWQISRGEGAIFFAAYVGYTVYLVLDATDHAAFPDYQAALLYGFLPLSTLIVTFVGLRSLRENLAAPSAG